MFRKAHVWILLVLLLSSAALVAQTARHPLKLDDIPRFHDVRDPQLSPDGQRSPMSSAQPTLRKTRAARIFG